MRSRTFIFGGSKSLLFQKFTAYRGFGAYVLGHWFEKYDCTVLPIGPCRAPRITARRALRESDRQSPISPSRNRHNVARTFSSNASSQNSSVGTYCADLILLSIPFAALRIRVG